MPFAGHPNIGTAFSLATAGEFGEVDTSIEVIFEEKAGLVPISIKRREGQAFWCELAAPETLSIGKIVSSELVASAASLTQRDIVTTTHVPQFASVGLPFLMTELKDRSALERARVQWDGLEAIAALGVTPDIHLYVQSADDFDVRARMFAPMDGVPEDAATGSANCALAALLGHYNEKSSGEFHFRIAQGVEMGRPSILDARAEKRDGVVVGAWIGGSCVAVSEGVIEVD
jgi:trans-2,3-dihydro-3-hydroxyanthranilate isomerase